MRRCLAIAATLLVGCAPWPEAERGDPLAASGATAARQPVYYGESSPTLYTSLSSSQQDAVVALCLRYQDQCFCSGSLISPRVVLTAAHCIDTPEMLMTAADIEVHIGADSDSPHDVLTALAVEYKDWQLDYSDDVGVVVLDAAYHGATPLPIRNGSIDAMGGQQAQVVGYGMTEVSDYNTLRKWSTMDVESVDYWGVLVDGHGLTGVAPGDSGSPLLYDFGAGVRVAGIASTSQDGWVYSANYTSVAVHESWILSIIDSYESPACQSACGSAVCGTDQGCFCGSCARDEECVSGQCQEIPAGSGGRCLDFASYYSECASDDDCPGDEGCFVYPEGDASECGEPCGPDPCADGDPGSYCYPFPTQSGYASLCLESDQESCTDENGYCATSDGRTGYCLDLYYDGTVVCYAMCRSVVTCPEGTACYPLGASCEGTCAAVQCGQVGDCDCGACPGGLECVANACQVCQQRCEGRVCGPDGCGGDCGACAAEEYCSAEGLCVFRPGSDAGTRPRGDASGSLPVSHEVAICGCGQAGPLLVSGWGLLLLLGLARRRPSSALRLLSSVLGPR